MFYKTKLYLNLIKYFFKDKFKIIEKEESLAFLKNYFKDKKNGFYIDAGCYHPIRLSNTKFLHDKGWEGINIDISKKSIDLFNIVRKKDINLILGLSDKEGIANAYFEKDLFFQNTINYAYKKKFLSEKSKKKNIEIKTLNYVIKKYTKNKIIDLIDVDCEGQDLNVLKGLDLTKHNVRMILIEVHRYNDEIKKNAHQIFEILKANNYKLLFSGHNCIFKKD